MISIRDAAAFESGEGICYTICATGKTYTRADFLKVANGEVAVAKALFFRAARDEPLEPEELLKKEATQLHLPVYRYDPVSHWHWLEVFEWLSEEKRTLLWECASRWRWKRYREQYGTNTRFAQVPTGIAYIDGGECDYSAERAERLEEHADKHRAAGTSAYERSNALVEHIPLGQPIMRGHHSEKSHRRTLERSQNLMFTSVDEMKTAENLEDRAESSRRHQAAKQSPGQMHRRIERLKAEKRGYEREIIQASEVGNESYKAELQRRIAIIDKEIAALDAELEEAGGILADRIEINKGDIINIDGFVAEVMTQPRKNSKTFNVKTLQGGTPLRLERSTLSKKLYTASEWEQHKAKANQQAEEQA